MMFVDGFAIKAKTWDNLITQTCFGEEEEEEQVSEQKENVASRKKSVWRQLCGGSKSVSKWW